MTQLSQEMSIAIVNFSVKSGDKATNLKRIGEFVEEAAHQGANLILFPEMSLTGYDYYIDDSVKNENKLELAETVPGEATDYISELTKQHKLYAVFGMPEREIEGGHIFNSAAVAGPEGFIGVYRKIHPYDKENKWCVQGDKPFMFNTPWGPIGIGICYDTYHFPELMRYYAWKGCRLYLNLTAVIRETVVEDALQEGYLIYLKSGVLMNHIFIASSNLVGLDLKNTFGGGSILLGPQVVSNDTIAYSSCYGGDIECDYERMYISKIDLALAKRTIFENNPYTAKPAFRPDLYSNFYSTFYSTF